VTAATLTTAMLVRLGEVSNHTFVLPLVIVYPTSRCNSRCMSCDWWKQSGAGDLSLCEIDGLAGSLPALGTKLVVFSGGEPLLRPEVFDMAALFEGRGLTLHLLTSGVLLERFPSLDRQIDFLGRHRLFLNYSVGWSNRQPRGGVSPNGSRGPFFFCS